MLDFSSIQSPIVTAFNVQLNDGATLAVSEIVRVVPNKRLVCKAVWQNQPVYAKLFIGADAKRYAQRDQQGVQALIDAKIATPDLLYAGMTGANEVLIYRAIERSQNAETLYQQLYQSQQHHNRLDLMCKLTEMVAQLHSAGLQQTDLHLKNFLVEAEKIYAIDGDGVRPLSAFLNKRHQLRNLATLFSKMDALDNRWITVCYAHYCQHANQPYTTADMQKVTDLTLKIRQKMAHTYADKKVFRSCTDVAVTQDFKQYRASARDFDATDLSIKWLDDALNNPQARLKSGNTCTVGKAKFANAQIAIKRYNIKNIWHGFKLSVSQSRAAKSWSNAYRLGILNIATAKPLALIEARIGCLKQRAYLLTAYIDAPNIADFYALSISNDAKKNVAHATALLFLKLKLLRISHGDCKATNIKVVDEKPVLIDLDSMQAHAFIGLFSRKWFEKKHLKDLKRFMQNWADDAETSALFKQAFVQVYAEYQDGQGVSILERAKIA